MDVAVHKSCSWQPVHGSVDSVDVVFVADEESPPSAQISGSELVLSRDEEESGPCEITVEFQERLCHVRSISILSSARTCEIYSLENGEVQYICTARGDEWEDQPVEEAGDLYETEVELVNSDAWAGVKVRLLSLPNKSMARVMNVTITAVVGPPPEQEAEENNTGSSMLSMLIPSVLHMVRNMSDNSGRIGSSSLSLASVEPSRNDPQGSEGVRQPEASTSGVNKEADMQEQGFQNEMRHRLQSLEMVCSRMESFLYVAFGRMEGRINHLEEQVGSILCQLDSSSHTMAVVQEAEPRAPDDEPLPTVSPPAEEHAEQHLDEIEEAAASDSAPVEFNEASTASVSTDDPSFPVGRTSVSLDDAWASALAAFSTSTSPMRVSLKTATLDQTRTADSDDHRPADATYSQPSSAIHAQSSILLGSNETEDSLEEEGSLQSLEGSAADILDQVVEVEAAGPVIFFDEVVSEAVTALASHVIDHPAAGDAAEAEHSEGEFGWRMTTSEACGTKDEVGRRDDEEPGAEADTKVNEEGSNLVELDDTRTVRCPGDLIELLDIGHSDGRVDTAAGDLSSDSLLIDCVDGDYVMCQQDAPAVTNGLEDDGSDLVFLPSFEERDPISSVAEEAVDLLST